MQLPAGERRQLLALVAALPAISLLLATAGLVRTRRWLDATSVSRSVRRPSATDLHAAQRAAALAEIAGRRGAVRATCLRQALFLHWLLRRQGLLPVLRLGVRKTDGVFDAHAWVELDGVPLGQSELLHTAFERQDWSRPETRNAC
jgi:hypothetical protein